MPTMLKIYACFGQSVNLSPRNIRTSSTSFFLIGQSFKNMTSRAHYVVRISGIVGEWVPRTLPPTSMKFSCPGRGLTFPSASTWMGYLRICPCNNEKSSEVYLLQFSSAIAFTLRTQSKLPGSSKVASSFPRCSPQSDIL